MPTPSLKVFSYLTSENAALYRAIMAIFTESKERFVVHLRPSDLRLALATLDKGVPQPDGLELDRALTQLCDWKAVERHPDMTEVATVEDFYRPRFVYQLTPAGEAVEQAVQLFLQTVSRPGELQSAALADIADLLATLNAALAQPGFDEARFFLTLQSLVSRFEDLTDRAQAFMGGLQRTIDLHGVSIAQFQAYKTLLIGYLERFVGELVLSTGLISEQLLTADGQLEALIAAAVRREVIDALAPTAEDLQQVQAKWRGRWAGLRAWFIGFAGYPSQAEILRARARAAIPALLQAAAAINDRRMTRTDRVADLRCLARWFAQAGSERDAHALWRVAFALTPARHLSIDTTTVDAREETPVSSQLSWHEAPPLSVSPRLRRQGTYQKRGRQPSVVDHSEAKAFLEQLAQREALELLQARAVLEASGKRRLSELDVLPLGSFELFLDLLGEALNSAVREDGSLSAASSDGGLILTMRPTEDGQDAVVRTAVGSFIGRDHWIEIHPPERAGRRTSL